MNTKQIDYILELAQTQNFNRAAENLYISQSTLTYQIKEVEKELNFLLFERSGKGYNRFTDSIMYILSTPGNERIWQEIPRYFNNTDI